MPAGPLSASGGPGGPLRLRRSGGALSASGGPAGAPGRADNSPLRKPARGSGSDRRRRQATSTGRPSLRRA